MSEQGLVHYGAGRSEHSSPEKPAGRKPRLIDLCCKAGGAARGYQEAGLHVVGVDIKPQPRYCGDEFIQADMLDLTPEFIAGFDAAHASPPCQGYSAMRHAPGAVGAPRLITQTQALFEAAGLPWVIENVEQAAWAMPGAVTLCGSMFGLGAQGCWTKRHRLFLTSFPLTVPPCDHPEGPVIGVFGGHARKRSAKHGGRGTRDVWEGGHKAAASEALGIDWMTLDELSEAIPPAFTRFIGAQLLAHLQRERLAA